MINLRMEQENFILELFPWKTSKQDKPFLLIRKLLPVKNPSRNKDIISIPS